MRAVEGYNLEARYEAITKSWRKICDLARKNNRVDFYGIRKIETTVSMAEKYHMHIHILISGRTNAFWVLGQWMRINQGFVSIKGQDVRKVKDLDNALLEIMKYTTKMTTSVVSKSGVREERAIEPYKLDLIYRSIFGKRLIQSFGGLKAFDENEMQLDTEVVRKAQGYYKWCGIDWYHTEYAQSLSDFRPDNQDLAIERAWTRNARL